MPVLHRPVQDQRAGTIRKGAFNQAQARDIKDRFGVTLESVEMGRRMLSRIKIDANAVEP